jgi:hypothetical protein
MNPRFYWNPPWWGPYVDPLPPDFGWARGPEPQPWYWGGPVLSAGPQPDPWFVAAQAQPPRWGRLVADPEPNPWFASAQTQFPRWGRPGPITDPFANPWLASAQAQFPRWWGPQPGDPAPDDLGWRPGLFSNPALARTMFRPNTDPPVVDIASHARIFERYLVDILRAGGLDDAHLAKATVVDLVEAYKVSITPPAARAESRALSATQVAAMDRGKLESLKLHLQSETARLSSLAKVVEQRLGEVK